MTLLDSHHVLVEHGVFVLAIDNSDHFLNLASVTISSWAALTSEVQPHGLLGQSWRSPQGVAAQGQQVAQVQGSVDDYLDAEGDLFGHRNAFDRFQPDSE